MTKKEYCKNNPGMAALATSAFGGYVVHGVEYGINDYAYITYETDNGVQAYHKLMIRHTTGGGAYVLLNGTRLKLAEFCRI